MMKQKKRLIAYIPESINDSGKLNLRIARNRMFLTLFQFLMISYLFIVERGWQWWYLLMIPIMILLNILDVKKIYPKEVNFGNQQSKIFMTLVQDVKDIKDDLQKMCDR